MAAVIRLMAFYLLKAFKLLKALYPLMAPYPLKALNAPKIIVVVMWRL